MNLTGYATGEIAVAMVFTGIVVVFCALVGLWFIVALFGKFFSSMAAKAPAPAPKTAPQPAVKKPDEDNADEIVAVIAAAVAAASGGAEVVTSVREITPAVAASTVNNAASVESNVSSVSVKRAPDRSGWAQAGISQNTQPF